jgi:hypothetical protein
MSDSPVYLHISPEGTLPDVAHLSPFRAVVIIDCTITSEWQVKVSDWLVQSGCLYMMAWGLDCTTWDDSVDFANLRQFNYGDIPSDQDVFTTWHASEPLEEAFYFCKYNAIHPVVDLQRTVLLHVSAHSDSSRIVQGFVAA